MFISYILYLQVGINRSDWSSQQLVASSWVFIGQVPGKDQRVEFPSDDGLGTGLSPGPSLWCLTCCWCSWKWSWAPLSGQERQGPRRPTQHSWPGGGARRPVVCPCSRRPRNFRRKSLVVPFPSVYYSPARWIEMRCLHTQNFLPHVSLLLIMRTQASCFSLACTLSCMLVQQQYVGYFPVAACWWIDVSHAFCCVNFGIDNNWLWKSNNEVTYYALDCSSYFITPTLLRSRAESSFEQIIVRTST